MKERILFIQNTFEWAKLENILSANQVLYRLNEIRDSSFPSNDQSVEIIISEKDFEQFVKPSDVVYESKIFERRDPKFKRYGIWQILLFLYAIGMTMLFLKYYNINSKSGVDKNFEHNWNYNNTALTLKEKKTNQVAFVYFDANFDNNYERVEGYTNGKKHMVNYDADENGVFEKINYYDLNGVLSGRSTDSDSDGLFNRMMFILEDGRQLNLIDLDKNGVYEIER